MFVCVCVRRVRLVTCVGCIYYLQPMCAVIHRKNNGWMQVFVGILFGNLVICWYSIYSGKTKVVSMFSLVVIAAVTEHY